jgi:hypothetical protein
MARRPVFSATTAKKKRGRSSFLWQGRVAKRLGLQFTLRPRGRPKKKGQGDSPGLF